MGAERQKKTVDFCQGCPDNMEDFGDTVYCNCVRSTVVRVLKQIEPGDKNRNMHCQHRKKEAKVAA